jgi:hypothetical protein
MKKINSTIALLILVLSGYAQTSNCNDHALAYGKVISKEEMTVTGSFQYTIQITATDTCYLSTRSHFASEAID